MKDSWDLNDTKKYIDIWDKNGQSVDSEVMDSYILLVPGALKYCFGKLPKTADQIVRGIYETSGYKSTDFSFQK